MDKGETDPNSLNSEENAPIHSLVKRKAKGKKNQKEKMHLLVTLLTFGDVDIDMLNGDGYTALHLAVKVIRKHYSSHIMIQLAVGYGWLYVSTAQPLKLNFGCSTACTCGRCPRF